MASSDLAIARIAAQQRNGVLRLGTVIHKTRADELAYVFSALEASAGVRFAFLQAATPLASNDALFAALLRWIEVGDVFSLNLGEISPSTTSSRC